MKKFKFLLAIGLVAVSAAFTTYVAATYYSVGRFTPYYTSNAAWTTSAPGQAGGRVNTYIVGTADTLKFGDVVWLTGVGDSVHKSATLANYNTIAGVVVGGQRMSGGAGIAASDSGTIAGTAGQYVYVLKQGRAWVNNDANGTIAGGVSVIPSDATAGFVETRTTAIDTLFRTIGRVVVSTAASKFMLVDVNVR